MIGPPWNNQCSTFVILDLVRILKARALLPGRNVYSCMVNIYTKTFYLCALSVLSDILIERIIPNQFFCIHAQSIITQVVQ